MSAARIMGLILNRKPLSRCGQELRRFVDEKFVDSYIVKTHNILEVHPLMMKAFAGCGGFKHVRPIYVSDKLYNDYRHVMDRMSNIYGIFPLVDICPDTESAIRMIKKYDMNRPSWKLPHRAMCIWNNIEVANILENAKEATGKKLVDASFFCVDPDYKRGNDTYFLEKVFVRSQHDDKKHGGMFEFPDANKQKIYPDYMVREYEKYI